MTPLFGFDSYAPREVAELVEKVGIAKARLPFLQTWMLGMLAGAFIGLGVCAAEGSNFFGKWNRSWSWIVK